MAHSQIEISGRDVPLGQEDNLNLVADILTEAMDLLPADQAGLALIAAGLDVLPAARCTGHYRTALFQVRAEVDRLLAEIEEPVN